MSDEVGSNLDGLAISSKMHSNARHVIEEVLKQFPEIVQIWTYANFPDHNNCRCCDFMITIPGIPRDKQIELGNAIADYLKKNAKRLGVNGIIWNRRVMGFPHVDNPPYRGPWGVWRPYGGPKPHTDHVHMEVDDRIYQPPTGFPTYVVDAHKFDPNNHDPQLARVDSKTGKTIAWVKPGYQFKGRRIVSKWGRKWVESDKGNLYALQYVTKVVAK